MESSKRLTYISYLIIGIIFILAGIALNEIQILINIDNSSLEEKIQFIEPWIGNPENGGLPRPWEP